MYQLFVQEHFDAAHYLPDYHGKCEKLHGHRFTIVVRLNASSVNDDGMAYDFAQLKQVLREVLSPLDHSCLNDVPPFDHKAPSCENLAATIYGWLEPHITSSGVTLAGVEVWESPTSGVYYQP